MIQIAEGRFLMIAVRIYSTCTLETKCYHNDFTTTEVTGETCHRVLEQSKLDSQDSPGIGTR